MKRWLFLAVASFLQAAEPLPLVELPKGQTFLVFQPHHDDHTTDYGMGGLIARLVDEGWKGWFLRASNDEKDGAASYGVNDQVNLRESQAAGKVLGMEGVYSMSWRNDYMDSIPLLELREQLIVLIRKHRPDVVLGHDPWAHYDRNPDHRKVARALAEATWMSGLANVHPEHLALGLRPHRVPVLFLKARWDYGRGHEANVAVSLTAEQVRRKAIAYQTHRNVYASPAMGASICKQLEAEGLTATELDGLSDGDAAVRIEEWYMDWISRKVGAANGAKYAEIYYRVAEFDHLPGLKSYLEKSQLKK